MITLIGHLKMAANVAIGPGFAFGPETIPEKVASCDLVPMASKFFFKEHAFQ